MGQCCNDLLDERGNGIDFIFLRLNSNWIIGNPELPEVKKPERPSIWVVSVI